MMKKRFENIFWIILVIISFIVFNIAGVLRVTNFGTEKIDIGLLIYSFIIVFFFCIFLFLNGEFKRGKYYDASKSLIRRPIILSIIYPKSYFKKQNFWRGYIIYLTSRASLIVSIYLLIKLII